MEAALVERKYGVFGGGFGASHVIDRPGEMALFVAALVLSQALIVGLFFLALRGFHGRRSGTPLFLFNFAFFALAGGIALLTVKYEVLSYFSDAIGFQLIRNLGGGSLFDALLFVMDEAALLGLAAAGAGLAYWVGLRLVRRYAPPSVAPAPLRWKHLLWPALALPFVAFAANRDADTRYALTRFNAYAIADTALAGLSDFDGDGYSWFGARIDRHPFDPARHPLALDVPNNGVDEDGYGGDFRFDGVAPGPQIPKLPEDRKHLVLIVLESVRGDALGKEVAGRPVTPVLNALAREGSVARQAYSHVGFTTASLKSLFSGALDPAAGGPSLFRDMKANGYRIGVYSGQPESFGDISAVVGMKENADIFVDAETLKDERAFGFAAKGSLLVDGRKLLREFDKDFGTPAAWSRPNFLYLNFQEAHFPYHHPDMPRLLPGEPIPRGEIGVENREWVEATYWNAVAYGDWLVGQVVERLKRQGVWEDTLLVVTADHGESLFDDAFLGHGHVINRQQTHIPLVLSAPEVPVEGPVGLADYRALILRALGGDVAGRASGGPVFQHIGGLDWPTAIGMVEGQGTWTTLMLETDELWFSDTGRRVRVGDLAVGSPEALRARRLTDLWARERWLAHLARR